LPLAEKYLTWNWASTARSAEGLPVKDPEFYDAGFAPDVTVQTTDGDGYFELRSSDGSAVLSRPYATIFSHVMTLPPEEIHDILQSDL
jgi:hypothetical protein